MIRASWNGELIAESEHTIKLEGNHYFPIDSVRAGVLRPSTTTTRCPWKGRASYHTIIVGDRENRDAAWYYSKPMITARNIEGNVAFWHGVEIEDDGGPRQQRSFISRFRRPPRRARAALGVDGSAR
jgi:uncharacterized protein (DUF427 family)